MRPFAPAVGAPSIGYNCHLLPSPPRPPLISHPSHHPARRFTGQRYLAKTGSDCDIYGKRTLAGGGGKKLSQLGAGCRIHNRNVSFHGGPRAFTPGQYTYTTGQQRGPRVLIQPHQNLSPVDAVALLAFAAVRECTVNQSGDGAWRYFRMFRITSTLVGRVITCYMRAGAPAHKRVLKETRPHLFKGYDGMMRLFVKLVGTKQPDNNDLISALTLKYSKDELFDFAKTHCSTTDAGLGKRAKVLPAGATKATMASWLVAAASFDTIAHVNFDEHLQYIHNALVKNWFPSKSDTRGMGVGRENEAPAIKRLDDFFETVNNNGSSEYPGDITVLTAESRGAYINIKDPRLLLSADAVAVCGDFDIPAPIAPLFQPHANALSSNAACSNLNQCHHHDNRVPSNPNHNHCNHGGLTPPTTASTTNATGPSNRNHHRHHDGRALSDPNHYHCNHGCLVSPTTATLS